VYEHGLSEHPQRRLLSAPYACWEVCRFGHVLLHGGLRSAGAFGVRLGKALRLGNLPSFWDGFRWPAALGFCMLLLMKRLQSRG
jgi:hypothetical protein